MTVYFHEKLAQERAKTVEAKREASALRVELRQFHDSVVPVASPGRRLTERAILEDRLAHLTWAAVSLSDGGYVCIEDGPAAQETYKGRVAKQSRVTVRHGGVSHTSTSDPDVDRVNVYACLVVAMDRAVAWLRQQALGA